MERPIRGGMATTVVALLVAGAAVAALVAVLLTAGGSGAHRVRLAPPADRFAAPAHIPSRLFGQDAHAGTFLPAGSPGEYLLALTGVHPNAIWFQDRPGRAAGTLSVARLLGAFFTPKRPQSRPNAVVNVLDPAVGHQRQMGVTILSARYDRARATLDYRVRALRQTGSPEALLPRAFSHTSLLIDDLYDHTCTAGIWDLSGSATLSSTWSRGSDTWLISPPKSYSGNGIDWRTQGDDAHPGCGNTVAYTVDFGDGPATVSVNVADPYDSGNYWSCTVTGNPNVQCVGPGSADILGGNQISIDFMICETNVPAPDQDGEQDVRCSTYPPSYY